MPENLELEFSPMALAMELVPTAVQIIGISALLILTYGEPTHSIAAIMISLIWIKQCHSNMPEEYGKLRTTRYLFGKLAGWLNQNDGESEYDDAASKFMMFDGSIESNLYRSVITAAGLANGLRGTASFAIHVYLIFTILAYISRIA